MGLVQAGYPFAAVFTGMLAVKPDAMDRGVQGLAGASAVYRCYECADGQYVSVGAVEPKFRQAFGQAIGVKVDARVLGAEGKKLTETLVERFRARTRDEWCAAFDGVDTCVAPVLTLAEAFEHPHMRARGVHQTVAGVIQPSPAPRFSRTPGAIQGPEPAIGAGGRQRLRNWGVAAA